MHDVQFRARFPGEKCGALDRLQFGGDGPRSQKITNTGTALIQSTPGQTAGEFLTLRMDRDRQSEPRGFSQTFEEGQIVGARKLRQPRVAQESFKANSPRSASSGISPRLPGTSPPHRAKSVMDAASRAARLRSNSRAFTVHGVEFSGISKNSVPPPAASARLPEAAPSHSARPGSLK